MEFPKQLKDQVYALLQEPTLDKFREFLHSQTGEHNAIDFKRQWIENADLAKEMLALANSQGGFIVFGVAENDDKSVWIEGLSEIKDKAVISNGIKKFISSNLKYEIYDFSYTTAEYEALNDKKFQMLVVEDTPKYIPFLAKKESGSLKQNMIYVRRGTSCEIANEEELQAILNKRMNYLHPLNGEPLQLEEHLKQLKILYEKIDKNHVYYKNSFSDGMFSFFNSMTNLITGGEKIVDPIRFIPTKAMKNLSLECLWKKRKKLNECLIYINIP